jgi:GDPmannose 4,6-dehydratase
MKKVLITGVTGQDGAYLSRLLLKKGYIVYGGFRRTATVNFWRLEALGIFNHPQLHLIEFDLTDQANIIDLISSVEPDEIYNLAAQSFVAVSFKQPITTANITGLGALHLLEAIRIINPKIKFYQASTSEMFGKAQDTPQSEKTAFYPRSPYAIAKLFAHWMTINHRESYNIFGVCGILFNHESPLRGLEFVTRKITDGVAKIHLGKQRVIELGNLDAKRDWGYADEYVEGMWKMLQVEHPDTFILATNKTHSIRDFTELSFKAIGVNLEWEGQGLKEIGVDKDSGKTRILINPKYFRPTEVDSLLGNPMKAKKALNWEAKTSLEKLSSIMVESDLERNRNASNS